jgi:hypothetical protein
VALAAETSSSTLLCDLRRPVKRPSPGLPMTRRCVCLCGCLKRTALSRVPDVACVQRCSYLMYAGRGEAARTVDAKRQE